MTHVQLTADFSWRRILQSYLIKTCLVIVTLCGQSSLSVAQVSLTSNSLKLDSQEEFLPVTEAFKLHPSINNEQLILHWVIAPGYYLYEGRFKFQASNNLTLTTSFSQGIKKYDDLEEKEVVVFHDQAVVTLPIPAGTDPFDLAVTSQGCADAGLCYPPRTVKLHIDPAQAQVTEATGNLTAATVQATTSTPVTPPANEPPKLWLLQAILFALIGGAILNLMPCVFPVLSLKVMSLAQASPKHMVQHGWAYTLGIVVCFLGFATILLLARAGGEAIGWGFQLQSPMLVASLAYLFFVMGLSMSGMIHIGTGWMGAGQSLTEKSGMTGSFFTGVLAAVVASPCTAPFMGAALGFALTQPGLVSVLIFAALGFGMALPLLILCYVPALANRLPRPGAWMEILKEVLAFPLYITAIWLLWVLGNQVGVNSLIAVCLGAVLIAFAIWLLNRTSQGTWQWIRRLLILASLAAAIALPWQQIHDKSTSRWQAYSPQRLDELRASGKPVFIDFTASWCITCLVNERVALNTDDVEKVFDELQVVTLKGDYTNYDPQITALLAEYGRSGVPLYLWFPAHHQGKGIVLPQILTKGLVTDALRNGKKAE